MALGDSDSHLGTQEKLDFKCNPEKARQREREKGIKEKRTGGKGGRREGKKRGRGKGGREEGGKGGRGRKEGKEKEGKGTKKGRREGRK